MLDLSISLNHTFLNNGINNDDDNGIIMATLKDPIGSFKVPLKFLINFPIKLFSGPKLN